MQNSRVSLCCPFQQVAHGNAFVCDWTEIWAFCALAIVIM